MANYYNKDLYKILELSFDASPDEIKSAYRKLARIYHPDVASSPEQAVKFKEIKEAYDVLSDETARRKYDVLHGFYKEKIKKEFEYSTKNKYNEYIKKAKKKSQTNESFTKSVNEALDNLFHSKKTSQHSEKNSNPPVNGEDIFVDLKISYLEALNGTNRKVNILHTQPCPNCHGHKFINGSTCLMCNGTGTLSLQKKINVKIPKGVSKGSKVRIKSEGNKGINGGKDGNLFLILDIEQNPFFSVDGLNLLCNLPISPFEAVLGADIELPVSDGTLKVKIPPMSSSCQKLKIPNEGICNKDNSKKGDLIINLLIKLPESYSQKELELYKKLKSLSTEDIRKDLKNV